LELVSVDNKFRIKEEKMNVKDIWKLSKVSP
jgi:hypothetical protein